MKPKVALFKSRLAFPGGLEKYSLALARHFAQRGCDVTILTTSDQKMALPPFEEGKIEILGKSSSLSFYHHLHFDRLVQSWCQRHRPDILFGMERNSHQTHLRAGSGVHAAFLEKRRAQSSRLKNFSFTINPLHRVLLNLEKKGFEDPKLKRLFVNSNMVKEEILSHYQTPKEKIEVVHNGVEWQAWEEPFLKSLEKKREEKIQFLFVGNGYRRKGLEPLLYALAELPALPFHLSVVGRDKEVSFFQTLTRQLSLNSKVTFLGQVKNMVDLYSQNDVLILPTLYDPFANVTVEALAMGLFVLTSRFNGAHEILTPDSGMVIENLFDTEELTHSLRTAASQFKTKNAAQMRRQSIRHLDFSSKLDKIVTKTLDSL